MLSKMMDFLDDLRPKQIILLALGAGLAMLIVAYSGFSLLGSSEHVVEVTEQQPAPQLEKKTVLVAKSDIAAHTIINERLLELKQVPADTVPLGALDSFASAVGRPAGVSIYAGDIITSKKLFSDNTNTGLADSIPPDCRAVSIGVSNITGVAGFAKAGNHVDVILVQKDEYSAKSRMLLQNVLLLSINKDSGESDSSTVDVDVSVAKASSEDPTIATLALLPEEAMALVSAAALGEIYLTLRPPHPSSISVSQTDFTMNSMVKPQNQNAAVQAKPVQAPAPAVAAPAPVQAPAEVGQQSHSRYEIIQGDKITQK